MKPLLMQSCLWNLPHYSGWNNIKLDIYIFSEHWSIGFLVHTGRRGHLSQVVTFKIFLRCYLKKMLWYPILAKLQCSNGSKNPENNLIWVTLKYAYQDIKSVFYTKIEVILLSGLGWLCWQTVPALYSIIPKISRFKICTIPVKKIIQTFNILIETPCHFSSQTFMKFC